MIAAPKPFLMDGTHNTRELGGYPIASDKHTKTHVFLRSDTLAHLSKADEEFLYRYGVRTVIDLRSETEAKLAPDVIKDFGGIRYHNIPMTDHIHDGNSTYPSSIATLYYELLDGAQNALRAVFSSFLQEKECVLFHCTAGKDRTGAVAMLLLNLMDASDETIVTDYAATESYMPPWKTLRENAQKRWKAELPEYLFRSEPQSMCLLLSHLKERYQNAAGYLKTLGFSDSDISTIKERFSE